MILWVQLGTSPLESPIGCDKMRAGASCEDLTELDVNEGSLMIGSGCWLLIA